MGEFTFVTGELRRHGRKSSQMQNGGCFQKLSKPASVGFSFTTLTAVLCLRIAAPLPTGPGSCGQPRPPRRRSRFCELLARATRGLTGEARRGRRSPALSLEGSGLGVLRDLPSCCLLPALPGEISTVHRPATREAEVAPDSQKDTALALNELTFTSAQRLYWSPCLMEENEGRALLRPLGCCSGCGLSSQVPGRPGYSKKDGYSCSRRESPNGYF